MKRCNIITNGERMCMQLMPQLNKIEKLLFVLEMKIKTEFKE